ncbi:MAG: MBL fold metallo-hydrolase [Vicinamibacterales bacterium]
MKSQHIQTTRARTALAFLFTATLTLTAGLTADALAQGRGAPQAPPDPVITQVRDNLYKVETGPGVAAVTVFLVTPEGIVLADTENTRVATWLKTELARRFPGRPVRYVLETHYHWDHQQGGAVFADTARFIGHANMPGKLTGPVGQARPAGDSDDLDGDGRLSREESQTATRAQFDVLDRNRDGFLTQQEISADVRPPDITFADRYTVELGGSRVELIWAKNRHTSDLYDIYFPNERVLFAQDYVWVDRLCCNFAFDRTPLADWIASVRALEALDFDIVVTSHWNQGTKADVVEFRRYLEAVRDAVSGGIAAGQTLEQMQQTIRLPEFAHFIGYSGEPAFATPSLAQVIESAYLNLTRYSTPPAGAARE